MDSYIEVLLNLVEKYKIDGVIHFAHWGCRWNYGRIKILKEALQRKGIPFLSLDCDSISSSDYFEGQLNSRVDTFLDMLS
jgi:benzoyl-CoA reductase/2-hydroxyglutaryl-CoA dehydratase subunit BcrC/BadD/HgdB